MEEGEEIWGLPKSIFAASPRRAKRQGEERVSEPIQGVAHGWLAGGGLGS